MNFFEKRKRIKYANQERSHPPLWIIGVPRSGSTILYQLLTSTGRFSYINNFISLFHRNLFTGFILNNLIFKDNRHDCFKSIHGNTWKCGWKGPNESGNFWYNWLDTANEYEQNNQLESKYVNEIKEIISAIINFSNRPLIFKNLYSGQRLPLIQRLDLESKIIYLKREPLQVLESILKARHDLNIKNNKIWSIKPKLWQDLVQMEETDLVIHQIKRLENQIEEDLKLFPKENVLVINYEQLSSKMEEIIDFCEIDAIDATELSSRLKQTKTSRFSVEKQKELKEKINQIYRE